MADQKSDKSNDQIWRALAGDIEAREASENWETLMNALDCTPDPAGRNRLLSSLDAGSGITSFAARVAVFLDITPSVARDELADLEKNPDRWFDYYTAPGLQMSQIASGPRHRGSECFAVRFRPGAEIPLHGHQGDEWGFQLKGQLSDSLGQESAPGDITHLTPNDTHRVWNSGTTDALTINIIEKGYLWK